MGQRHFLAEEEDALHWKLAENIIRSGFRPDLVLSLYRGGGKVAPAVVEGLREIMGWEFDDFPLKARRYGRNNTGGTNVCIWGVEILPKPPRGNRVLLLDDIYDEGHTTRATVEEIRRHYHSLELEILVGAGIYKEGNDPLGGKPDVYALKVDGKEWVVQTYEKESARAALLRGQLAKEGYTLRTD